jgi:hypothetical protein
LLGLNPARADIAAKPDIAEVEFEIGLSVDPEILFLDCPPIGSGRGILETLSV